MAHRMNTLSYLNKIVWIKFYFNKCIPLFLLVQCRVSTQKVDGSLFDSRSGNVSLNSDWGKASHLLWWSSLLKTAKQNPAGLPNFGMVKLSESAIASYAWVKGCIKASGSSGRRQNKTFRAVEEWCCYDQIYDQITWHTVAAYIEEITDHSSSQS